LGKLEAAGGADEFHGEVDRETTEFDFHRNLPFGVRVDLALDGVFGTEGRGVLAILGRDATGVASLAVESDAAQGIGEPLRGIPFPGAFLALLLVAALGFREDGVEGREEAALDVGGDGRRRLGLRDGDSVGAGHARVGVVAPKVVHGAGEAHADGEHPALVVHNSAHVWKIFGISKNNALTRATSVLALFPVDPYQ
jgi:hypothetical protein